MKNFYRNKASKVLLIFFIMSISTVAQNVEYELIHLSNEFAIPHSISEAGHVAGEIRDNILGWQAFIWKNDTLKIIPQPQAPDGWSISGISAQGCNSQGHVVGKVSLRKINDNLKFQTVGFYYDGSTTKVITAGENTNLYAINDIDIIVGSAIPNGETSQVGFYIDDNDIIYFPKLGPNGTNAFAINNLNDIVGNSVLSDGSFHAFRFSKSSIKDLGAFTRNSKANSINDHSWIVGVSDFIAFVWKDSLTGMVPLKKWSESLNSEAYAINDSGVIVGLNYGATIWEDSSAYDLNTLVETSDIYLTRALDINNKGQIITEGSINGQTRALLLNPIEIEILEPKEDDKWKVDQKHKIKWTGSMNSRYLIELSLDDGKSYIPIDTTDVGVTELNWKVSDTLSSSITCNIQVSSFNSSNALNKTSRITKRSKKSETFKIKGYDLTRIVADTLQHFTAKENGWSFGNKRENMWPETWWSQFNYLTYIDKVTNRPFSEKFPVGKRSYLNKSIKSYSFIDWPLFVDSYSIEQIYFSNPTSGFIDYRPSAAIFYLVHQENWGGSCYGFAVSSLLAWQYPNIFNAKFPSVSNSDNLAKIPLNDETRKAVNYYFWHQFGNEFSHQENASLYDYYKHDSVSAEFITPRDVLAELKKMFLADPVISKLLIFTYPTDLDFRHAVVPYKLLRENESPHSFKVFIYDNNSPLDNGKYIRIDSIKNEWKEELGAQFEPGNKGFFLSLPIKNYLETPKIWLRWEDDIVDSKWKDMELYLNRNRGEVSIFNKAGQKFVNDNSYYSSNIPGSFPIIPIAGISTQPIGYKLPIGEFEVSITNIQDSSSFFTIKQYDVLYSYTRTDVNDGDSEIMKIGNGITIGQPNDEERNIQIETIKVFQIH
ncbi:MAG: hypothetical protein H6613_08240 [Ignavibacteriales bacterium]|nr:hypothetical protein [Ignavibacteriales bacterium]